MKNLKLLFLSGFLLFSIMPAGVIAANSSNPVPATSKLAVESVQTKIFEARIAEIKAMDKSKLNAAEKKQLRKELRTMKHAVSGGVYLSVGAIIIIILLLILLL
ncbi:MAG: hypothetical protein ABIR66_06025 [Saprospiraceae bacterium]